jgi:hypothetical protein
MSSEYNEEITVFIKIIDNSGHISHIISVLNPNDRLSDIREKLENINDMLLFLKNENDESGMKREDEDKYHLKEIIKDNQNILYLKRLNWKDFSDKCKLGYGRIINFDEIKPAKEQACKINECELNEINIYKSGRLEFQPKEDWMKKTNLLVDDNGINIMNFAKLVGSLQDKSFNEEDMSAYKYVEIRKASLKFGKEYLNLTEQFEKDVEDATGCNNPKESLEKIKKIIEDYGQFIPTEIVLGSRVYYDDIKKSLFNSADTSKFYNYNHIELPGGMHPDVKVWFESLKNYQDYQNWECIEFREPISIFKLSVNLHKKAFESMGKKILYNKTVFYDYEPGKWQIYNIPQGASDIININKNCNVFASVIDDKNSDDAFFNCQMLKEQSAKPSIIIHKIQQEQSVKPSIIIYKIQQKVKKRPYNLGIRIMVIGHDTKFNSPSTIGVKLMEEPYDPQKQKQQDPKFYSTTLPKGLLTEKTFFGIPVLVENINLIKSLIIGHNFRDFDGQHKLDIFSYCSSKKRYDDLPKVTFCTLIVSTEVNTLPPSGDSFKSDSLDTYPKFVNLCLLRNDRHKPFLYSQKINQIKIKYLKCYCDKTCNICKKKTEEISKGQVKCIVYCSNEEICN